MVMNYMLTEGENDCFGDKTVKMQRFKTVAMVDHWCKKIISLDHV